MPKNVRYLGKLIVAKGFKKLPKVQKIVQSGHTAYDPPYEIIWIICLKMALPRPPLFHFFGLFKQAVQAVQALQSDTIN